MRLEQALKIFSLEKTESIFVNLLKKRYRELSKQIHPDKFSSEPQKLKATRNFIELQDAYEYLMSNITVVNEYLENQKSKIDQSEIGYKEKSYKSGQENYFESNDNKYSWLYAFILIPGGLIVTMLYAVGVLIFMDEFHFKRKIGKVIAFLLMELPLIGMVAGLIYEQAIEQSKIIPMIISFQIFVWLVYIVYSFIRRKYLEKKRFGRKGIMIYDDYQI